MKRYFSLFLILISAMAQAQTIIIGIVRDEKRNPMADINVTLQEKSGRLTLGFAMTDVKGAYKLEYKGKADSIAITVSGFNVQKQTKIVPNRNQNIHFSIESASILLNEVKITPPKIRQAGDTLNYLVESFSDLNDRTIGDVLKKMPGIKVQENGAILYQNRPINKFYIENADLLQGRYGIATNNIDAKDVSTVQVLENHQPIKALKDKEMSEDAAINLKLKDSAKGTIIANAQLGLGGSPLLWNNELTGMYIAKKLQNITIYKGNNSGDDATRELTSFYSNDASNMDKGGLLAVQSPLSPSIAEKRYLNNQANILSANNLWSLKNDYQLTTNVSYLNDLQRKDSYAFTEYYLANDSVLKIEEYMNSRLRKERLTGDIQLNANKDKFYFNNLFKLEGIWDRERGDVFSADSVSQYLKKPYYSINNTFNMVKTGEKYTWNFYSFFGYNSSTHTLSIEPVLYQDLLSPSTYSSRMIQSVEQDNLAAYNKVSLGFGKGTWKQEYAVSMRTDIQGLSSELGTDNTTNVPDSLKNDLRQGKYELIFSPVYTYAKGKLNSVLALPFNYTLLDVKNNLSDEKRRKNNFSFNPSLFLHYKISGYWTSYCNYSYRTSIGKINQLYKGYILSSYRSLLKNDGDVFEQKAHNASASLYYRDPITTLFGMFNISYSNVRTNLLSDYSYLETLTLRSSILAPSTTERLGADMHLSKDIETLGSTFFLGGNYTISRSSQVTQGRLIDYNNQGYSFSPRIITKISPSVNLQYEFKYSQSISKVKNEKKTFDPIRIMSHNIQLSIFPFKGMSLNLKCESFYNNAIISGSRSMTFGDISAKYKYKQLEFMFDYTNIFNSKQFVSASYTDVSRYYSAYMLRPTEVLLKVRFKLK